MSKPASALHRKLHLQHHKHTGRVLHHKHTSYRGLAVVIVLAGAVMLSLNILARATADDLAVYARNPAPIPTVPSVITSPAEGTVITKSSVTVSGTCPQMTPGVIVAITDNGTQAGSTPCTDDGTFSIPIVIDSGRNILIAKTYTITDDTGPDSAPVTIFRSAPPAQAGATSQQGGEAANGLPLVVTLDEPFIVFGPAKDAIWLGTITGGTPPYTVHIDWGDGSHNTYTVAESGSVHFTHHYRSMQPHAIIIRVDDAAGRAVLQHYAAVTPYVPPAPAITAPALPWNGSKPLGIYGAYLLLLAVFGGFWVHAHHSHAFAYAKVPVRPARSVRRKTRTSR